ncbi:MAG: hypothetical protein D6766_06270, partial [Verrucomicrobia bacterium]
MDAEWRWRKGLGEASQPDITAWRQLDFDDSSWDVGPAPFWYGERLPSPGTELPDMRGGYTCIFMRRTFEIANPADVETLTLGAHSDDGFVAWINGVEVARFNMPDGEPHADGTALPALREPIPFQTFEIANPADILRPGLNVLAVQAFNASLSRSSDFGINVRLDYTADLAPPVVERLLPPAGALVRSLRSIEVLFSEPVTGVDAADLLVDGRPADELEAFSDQQYVFHFAEPAPGTVQVAWAANHGITDRAGTPHPFAGGQWTYTLDPNAPPPGVIISEFMADNDDTLRDEDGDPSDWIELHNAGDVTVDLAGWHLTDQTNNLVLWTLPSLVLAPGDYRLIYASGKDRRQPPGPYHTNFRLAREGGYLALTDADGKVVSEFRFYPEQREDVSYGRDRFNPSVTGYFPQPTPGAPNSQGGPGFAPPVSFSPPGGTFTGSITVELSTTDPAAEIRYTTDGSVPDAGSPLYTGPLRLDAPTLIRARTYVPGLLPGDVRSEAYVPLAANVYNASSDLPLVVIHNFGAGGVPANTDQPAVMLVFEPTADGRSSLTNAPDFEARVGINIRGSSTQWYPKSSYSVEIWDEANEDRDAPLLGMPAESDWVFYAPNNFEPILIHNPFAHALSRQIGRYSPRTRFAEVYVNTRGGPVTSANYMGVYVIEEKIKRSPNRVDIERLAPEHTEPPEVTGGYLLKIDRANDPSDRTFRAAGQTIIYEYPKGPEMETAARRPQREYIRDYIEDFGEALNSPNFTDPVRGYRPYIDVPSWIDHHLLNVLMFNVDALRLSAYFYKPRNRPIEFGPLWDFDRALNSTDGRDANPRVWRAQTGDRGTDFFNYPWWGRLFRDPDFWQAYVDRYQELREGAFSLENLHALVDELTSQVREAQQREVARWSNHRPRGGSYDAEIRMLKDWLAARVEFMDTNFLDRPRFSYPPGPAPKGLKLTIYPAGKFGTRVYYTLDGTDPRLPGGGIRPDALSATIPVTLTINTNVRVTARCYNPAHANLTGPNNPPISTPWSGLRSATYIVETPPVRISEIMFHPVATANDGSWQPSDFEFLELVNIGSDPVDLRGFRVSGGIDFTFTNSLVVPSGQRVVLAANREAFTARYGPFRPVAGVFTNRLDNAGERLRLEGPLGEPILDFRYEGEWFPAADGLGYSLEPVDLQAAPETWSSPAQWRAAGPWLGSPGVPGESLSLPPAVRINEALAHPDPPAVDWVELYNPADVPADISGWFLSDDFGRPAKYRFPAGTILPPRSYLVITAEEFGAGPAGFGLSATGDEVFLVSADAEGRFTGHAHGFRFGATANGMALGRLTDSLDREHFVAQWTPTPGRPNFGPRVGPVVLSEIMFQPAPVFGTNNNTRDEFIEIANLTDLEQPLFDPDAPTNTWRLRGGVDFDFPPGLTLPPQGRLLLVGFDPERRLVDVQRFREVYHLPETTPLLGPWRGNLANEGESIRLLRPDTPQPAGGPSAEVPYVIVDEVDYAPAPPWPDNAAGTGLSLQRRPETAFGNDPAYWMAAAPTPAAPNVADSTDADADGLPDWWERAHGLAPDSASGNDGPNGDPDGDGATNRAEWLAGTDPRDPADVFRVSAADWSPEGRWRIRFRLPFNRACRVETAADPADGPWTSVA